jgi:hypothetical protein
MISEIGKIAAIFTEPCGTEVGEEDEGLTLIYVDEPMTSFNHPGLVQHCFGKPLSY